MGLDNVKSFLIADDDSDVREAIAEAIRHYYKDARIYMAADGSEAMQKLRNAPPSLVIIDLDMPKVTGVEMIEQMQKINSFSRIPIIVISGMDHESEEIQAIHRRGMMFAQKPFKTQYLMGLIEGVFNGNRVRIAQPEPRKLSAGEVLFNEGDPSGNMYLVKAGKFRVFKSSSEHTKEIGIIGPNELVGEMAFIDKLPRSATVEAIEPSEVIELPIADINSYLAQQPVWFRSLVNTILSRLREAIAIRE